MVLDLAKKGSGDLPLKQRDVRETSNIGLSPNITNFSDSQHNHTNAAGGGNTTHQGTDGTADHSQVSTNKTHVDGNGSDHADVTTNTTHISSNGSDHTFIDQDVTTTGTPTFGITTLGDSSQLASSAAPTADADIANKKYVDDNIGTGTKYWSCTGAGFIVSTETNQYTHNNSSASLRLDANATYCFADIQGIPNGAVITGAIVRGSISDETWSLKRITLSDVSTSTMASANINTEDTSISNATIDASLYGYVFTTSTLDNLDTLYGARITYTT